MQFNFFKYERGFFLRNIVISGATSFLGSKLTEAAWEKGYSVVAIVRPKSDKLNKLNKLKGNTDLRIIELEMSEYEKIEQLITDIDCFIHFAWNGTRGTSRQDAKIQYENYKYSMNAVKSVLNNGCRKILLAGSQAEYGSFNSVISEETICRPNTEYGKYKLKLYNDATAFCKERNATLIEPRFFSMYGPDDYQGTLIMSCLDNMLHDKPCELTECTQMWDYLYVDDAISAIMALFEKSVTSGVYNIGGGDIRMLRDYVLTMKSVTKSNSELCFGVKPYPPEGPINIQPDINKIKNATMWIPITTFVTGIQKLIQQYK